MTSPNTTPHRFGHRIAMVGVSILAAAVLAACSGGHAEEAGAPPPPQVSAAPVLVKQVSQWDEFSGRVEAVQSVELRPRVSGYIDKVNYVEGQEVKKGEVLFTIDARSYQAEYDRAAAELARARTQATLARSESERAKRLSEQQAISTETAEQRRAAADQSGAAVQAAQAALDAARLNLEFTKVRAPIDGRAGRAMVTAGNLVTAGDSASVLTTLVSLDTVFVYFDADESTFLRYAQMARKGERPSERDSALPVKVGLSGEEGYPHAGKVDFLDNQVARSTGTIRVRALLDNADRQFTPGLFARVRIPGSERYSTTLIPEAAIATDQDRRYVLVVDDTGTVEYRPVQLGGVHEGRRVVRDGLVPGEQVVVSGLQRARPGSKVTPQPADQPAQASNATPAKS